MARTGTVNVACPPGDVKSEDKTGDRRDTPVESSSSVRTITENPESSQGCVCTSRRRYPIMIPIPHAPLGWVRLSVGNPFVDDLMLLCRDLHVPFCARRRDTSDADLGGTLGALAMFMMETLEPLVPHPKSSTAMTNNCSIFDSVIIRASSLRGHRPGTSICLKLKRDKGN
jgi:hypothetical protein